MRPKQFLNFLNDYVNSLSEHSTLNLKVLEHEVKHNARLKEVASFLLLFSGAKQDILKNNKEDLPVLFNMYQTTQKQYPGVLLDDLALYTQKLDGYDPLRKLYSAYQSTEYFSRKKRKALLRDRVLLLKEQLNLSNYRLYKDLGLNHGNTNDFLKNNKLEKLSLHNVTRMLSYLNEMHETHEQDR